jgi:hypothetical protein
MEYQPIDPTISQGLLKAVLTQSKILKFAAKQQPKVAQNSNVILD